MPLMTTGFPRPPGSGPIFSTRVILAFEEWSTFCHLLKNVKLIEEEKTITCQADRLEKAGTS